VVRLLGEAGQFGEGDTVSLLLDASHRQMRVRVANRRGVSEHVAVRKLVTRAVSGTAPRVHAIAHLTDIAVPAIGQPASAVVEVLGGLPLPT